MSLLNFSNVRALVDKLNEQVDSGRAPHARLLVGKSGSGLLPAAMAHAAKILNLDKNDDKIWGMNHPDLHFSFPFILPPSSKKGNCEIYWTEWKEMIEENPCFSLRAWAEKIAGDINKPVAIGSDESGRIMKKLNLKSYLGGRKVLIMWKAELMVLTTSNKLLKLIEEPPEGTYIILLAENTEGILPTITSRCQLSRLGEIPTEEMANYLRDTLGLEEVRARNLSALAEGDVRLAESLATDASDNATYHDLFVDWMRNCYRRDISIVIDWVDQIDGLKREKQKSFLQYALNFYRQCMLNAYMGSDNALLFGDEKSFADKFGKFVHGGNVVDLMDSVDKSYYYLERNGNGKLIFLNLSMDIMSLLRREAPVPEA